MSEVLEEPVEEATPPVVKEEPRFEFDADFQTKICAHVVRDGAFVTRVTDLINPKLFENSAERVLAKIALDFFKKYETTPSTPALAKELKKLRPKLRTELFDDIVAKVKEIAGHELGDRDFAVDEVSQFAKLKAVENAMIESVPLMAEGRWAEIEQKMEHAMLVGAGNEGEEIDFWEDIGHRSELRKEELSGTKPPLGITTGIPGLDALLFHRGWGRKELTGIMGAAKAGKSTALGEFAKGASIAGYNVVYFTCEVAGEIIADRADANIASYPVDKLATHYTDVEDRIRKAASKAGKLFIVRYPPDTLRPADIRRHLRKYASRGHLIDLCVTDYADIMAPDFRQNDTIADSKAVWLGLRKIAVQENIAMLTATQTNRDGAKSDVAKATDVAEDYNKIRIADLIISINKNDEEKMNNEARLFFAASRNQRGEFTVRVKQELERMQFIKEILDVY